MTGRQLMEATYEHLRDRHGMWHLDQVEILRLFGPPERVQVSLSREGWQGRPSRGVRGTFEAGEDLDACSPKERAEELAKFRAHLDRLYAGLGT
jgi:hypothetical protein